MAAQILAACVSRDGKVLVPHFYDDVVPLQDWERQSFRKLNFDDQAMAKELNIPRPHGEAGYSTLERLWARPTFEINGLFGGYQGQRSKTIIPSFATVKITCRLVANQNPARIHKLVVAAHGAGLRRSADSTIMGPRSHQFCCPATISTQGLFLIGQEIFSFGRGARGPQLHPKGSRGTFSMSGRKRL